MNKLSKIVAEVWNRANRVFPKVTGAKILRFLVAPSDTYALAESDYSSFNVPYPAQWAPDSGQNSSIHAKWVGGCWANGTASSGAVSAADNIMAAHWNNLLTEFKNHNHDGIHGKQLINDSIEDESLTHTVLAPGSVSIFVQPSSMYTSGSVGIYSQSVAHIPSPTIYLDKGEYAYLFPGNIVPLNPTKPVEGGYTNSSAEYDIFFGVPPSASGTIQVIMRPVYQEHPAYSKPSDASSTYNINAGTVTSQVGVIHGTISNVQYTYFEVRRGTVDSCSDPLLIHGVSITLKTKP